MSFAKIISLFFVFISAGISQDTSDSLFMNKQESDSVSDGLDIKEGLPDNYPSVIPLPIKSKVIGYVNSLEGMNVTFESTNKPKTIYKDLKKRLEKNGFIMDDSEARMKAEGGFVRWLKDMDKARYREVSIMLCWVKDKNVCEIVVNYH